MQRNYATPSPCRTWIGSRRHPNSPAFIAKLSSTKSPLWDVTLTTQTLTSAEDYLPSVQKLLVRFSSISTHRNHPMTRSPCQLPLPALLKLEPVHSTKFPPSAADYGSNDWWTNQSGSLSHYQSHSTSISDHNRELHPLQALLHHSNPHHFFTSPVRVPSWVHPHKKLGRPLDVLSIREPSSRNFPLNRLSTRITLTFWFSNTEAQDRKG